MDYTDNHATELYFYLLWISAAFERPIFTRKPVLWFNVYLIAQGHTLNDIIAFSYGFIFKTEVIFNGLKAAVLETLRFQENLYKEMTFRIMWRSYEACCGIWGERSSWKQEIKDDD